MAAAGQPSASAQTRAIVAGAMPEPRSASCRSTSPIARALGPNVRVRCGAVYRSSASGRPSRAQSASVRSCGQVAKSVASSSLAAVDARPSTFSKTIVPAPGAMRHASLTSSSRTEPKARPRSSCSRADRMARAKARSSVAFAQSHTPTFERPGEELTHERRLTIPRGRNDREKLRISRRDAREQWLAADDDPSHLEHGASRRTGVERATSRLGHAYDRHPCAPQPFTRDEPPFASLRRIMSHSGKDRHVSRAHCPDIV